MGNMSYCRFENTLGDLEDCYEHIADDEELSASEAKARKRLIRLCAEIAADYVGDGNDYGLCKKCGGKMKRSVAMTSTSTGIPDFPGGDIVTLSPGGPGKLIPALKCGRCGWSVTI